MALNMARSSRPIWEGPSSPNYTIQQQANKWGKIKFTERWIRRLACGVPGEAEEKVKGEEEEEMRENQVALSSTSTTETKTGREGGQEECWLQKRKINSDTKFGKMGGKRPPAGISNDTNRTNWGRKRLVRGKAASKLRLWVDSREV